MATPPSVAAVPAPSGEPRMRFAQQRFDREDAPTSVGGRKKNERPGLKPAEILYSVSTQELL
jgi:hypothetical protein